MPLQSGERHLRQRLPPGNYFSFSSSTSTSLSFSGHSCFLARLYRTFPGDSFIDQLLPPANSYFYCILFLALSDFAIMRFSTIVALAATVLPFTNAYYKGFNVGANNADGSCKTQAQWETAFNKIKGLPQGITSIRLYAASDCNTLEYAVPAAIATGMQILVGVWAEDSTHYTAEKNALEAAINAHGSDWIIAISVGSEDLYRGDTTASALAQQVYDVRGMVRAMGVTQEVGHVDTWTAWVDDDNKAVITACDFIGLDGYRKHQPTPLSLVSTVPVLILRAAYFQNASIADASNVFWDSVTATRNQVNAVSSGKWVWVTETGWPVSGPDYGPAVPSVANAQTYWHTVACAAFQQIHIFWYAYQDYSASPSFGVFGSNGNAIYDLKSC